MQSIKKALSFLLSFALLLGLFTLSPTSAQAASETINLANPGSSDANKVVGADFINLLTTGPYTFSGSGNYSIQVLVDNTQITLNGVTIDITAPLSSAIELNGHSATITLEGNNVLTKTSTYPTIDVYGSSSLTLDGTGSLTVTAAESGCAAIGSDDAAFPCGSITINGGTYILTGGANANAIGAALTNPGQGTLTINGNPNQVQMTLNGGGIGASGNDLSLTNCVINGTDAGAFSGTYDANGQYNQNVTITAQPISPAPMVAGSVSGALTVTATTTNASTPTYRWYQSTDGTVQSTDVAETGTSAQTASFTIPTALTAGTYYYYCKVSTPGSPTRNSDVATVSIAVVPGAPTGVTAAAGDGQATVSFTPPANNGGSPIIGYTVTSNPGGITATGATSPLTVTGLSNGTAYTFTVTATNVVGTGAASVVSNSVTPTAALTAPGAPTGVTAAAGDGQATVSFTPPANNGGSPIIGYTVTSNPGGITATGATDPLTVTGLSNGTAYTFTVTATNAVGTGAASAASNSVTPTAALTAPGAPTGVTAAAGDGQATVSFTPPANNGGSPIIGYTVTSNPGGITATGATGPLTVTGLSNGTAYTFTVTATNVVGTGAASAASNSVTPTAVHIPVTSITGVPTTATAGTPLALSGIVAPSSATNQTIAWSVSPADNGSTGANVSTNTLTTRAAGTATIRATIVNGITAATDYWQDFVIAVGARQIAPTITGPAPMVLQQGYSATSTAAFTLTGNPPPSVTIAGNARIVWNPNTNCLDIAAGLPAGTYPVVLTASNNVGVNATLNYTITVKGDPTPLPKTGDSFPIGGMLVLLVGLMAAMGYVSVRMRRSAKTPT